jgi:D-3-phosphoglycerate dehydrogenase
MGKILVSENIVGPAMDALKNQFQLDFQPELWKFPEQLEKQINDSNAIIVRNQTRITRELIEKASSLQVIGRAGAGLDNIDVGAASNAGVVVVYAPEQNSISVAELTVGMMLSLARKISIADRDTKAGKWDRHRFTGIELYGKTLGIVGLGRIGFRTALRARAFGMNVIVHDDYVNPDGISISELLAPVLPLAQLLAQADFVSCHLPLTPQTKNLFDYKRFCTMKPTAFFINTSRGGIVDETGLIQALENEKIGGAALDVRQQEPPPADVLRQMDNVILTPHIAAFTTEGQDRVVKSLCRDVAAVLSGGKAINFANFSQPRKVQA